MLAFPCFRHADDFETNSDYIFILWLIGSSVWLIMSIPINHAMLEPNSTLIYQLFRMLYDNNGVVLQPATRYCLTPQVSVTRMYDVEQLTVGYLACSLVYIRRDTQSQRDPSGKY